LRGRASPQHHRRGRQGGDALAAAGEAEAFRGRGLHPDAGDVHLQ